MRPHINILTAEIARDLLAQLKADDSVAARFSLPKIDITARHTSKPDAALGHRCSGVRIVARGDIPGYGGLPPQSTRYIPPGSVTVARFNNAVGRCWVEMEEANQLNEYRSAVYRKAQTRDIPDDAIPDDGMIDGHTDNYSAMTKEDVTFWMHWLMEFPVREQFPGLDAEYYGEQS